MGREVRFVPKGWEHPMAQKNGCTKQREAYWGRVCEKDAAWDDYCRHPTQEFYDLYLQSLDEEAAALAVLLASDEWEEIEL